MSDNHDDPPQVFEPFVFTAGDPGVKVLTTLPDLFSAQTARLLAQQLLDAATAAEKLAKLEKAKRQARTVARLRITGRNDKLNSAD